MDFIFGIELTGAGADSGVAVDNKAAPSGKESEPATTRPSPKKPPAKKAAPAQGAKPDKVAAKDAPTVVATVVATEAKPFPKRLTGKVILSWRSALGETQAEFASRIGVSAGCISQWEKKLRQALNVRERALDALRKAWGDTQ